MNQMLKVVVVTVVKHDSEGLARTSESISSISSLIRHLIITPFDGSKTHDYATWLSFQNSNCDIVEDLGVGIYHAMNLALEHCQDEEWIWFLNAGDTLYSKENFFQICQKLPELEELWAYGGVELIDEDFSLLNLRQAPSSFSLVNQLFATKFVSHQSVLFRAKLLKGLKGFDLRFRVAADWDLMCRSYKIGRPANLKLALARFQLGGYSTERRSLGNFELLRLRQIHLGLIWQPLSLLWFIYRQCRIIFITLLDAVDPKIIRKWRHLRTRIVRFLTSQNGDK